MSTELRKVLIYSEPYNPHSKTRRTVVSEAWFHGFGAHPDDGMCVICEHSDGRLELVAVCLVAFSKGQSIDDPEHGDLEISPRPWIAYQNHYHEGWTVEGGGETLCQFFCLREEDHATLHHDDEHAEANAKMMAASPDLLKACEVSMECLNHFKDHWQAKQALNDLEVAIGKATK